MTNGTEGIRRQASELIEQAYQRGYKVGYEAAKENNKSDTESRVAELMEIGRNEAWEAAGKLVSMDYKECNKVLGDGVLTLEHAEDIFIRCTASEAINKLRAYEAQKQKEDSEIHVGDEVYLLDVNYLSIVTSIDDYYGVEKATCITQNGKWYVNTISELHKTGRHFSEIAEVLKKLQEGE
jgi:hypothetical protein